MREIKFRAWNIEDGIMDGAMHYPENDYAITPEGNLVRFITGGYPSPDGIMERMDFSKTHILMQYTGLKDKNGKEIFEEDIVKHTDGNVGVVYYWETKATFMVDFHDLGDPDGYHDQFDSYDMGYEVIGNIHENPKLLGKQNE